MQGSLRKMTSALNNGKVEYHLPLDNSLLSLNPLIGSHLKIEFGGDIFCTNCSKKTKKSFAQGHCFPCTKRLASCDLCILKPELCHHAQGTCRQPEWGEQFCMADHFVYLSNTSGLKVGITRGTQLPTRWIDQGAVQAMALLQVKNRFLAGLIEVEIAKNVADKTNWRRLLKGSPEVQDLPSRAAQLLEEFMPRIDLISEKFGENAYRVLDPQVTDICFPVMQYPEKITSHNFDKNNIVEGVLQGIKGQYLIFDTGVINIRKFTGYHVAVTVPESVSC